MLKSLFCIALERHEVFVPNIQQTIISQQQQQQQQEKQHLFKQGKNHRGADVVV